MPEIESEPITWQSFKSLPRLALITWLIVFLVDAIFIAPSGEMEAFTKLIWVWSIGLALALVFEFLRIYKKREKIEEREPGDYLFIPLNALLIFFYASAYNGFTREIGSWSEASDILRKQDSTKVDKTKPASIFGAVQHWAVPILAKQTSYWPDVKIIAEKNELKEENIQLKKRILGGPDGGNDKKLVAQVEQLNDSIQVLNHQLSLPNDEAALKSEISDLKSANVRLSRDVTKLTGDLNTCSADKTTLTQERDRLSGDLNSCSTDKTNLTQERDKLSGDLNSCNADKASLTQERDRLSGDLSSCNAEKASLGKERNKLSGDLSRVSNQRNALLNRINDFNLSQLNWRIYLDQPQMADFKATVQNVVRRIGQQGPPDHSINNDNYNRLFVTPIDTSLTDN